MAVNKIVLNTDDGEQVLVDLTGDSVSEGTLFEGETAHAANGEKIVGTFTLESEMYEQDTLIKQIKTALEGKASVDITDNGVVEVTPNSYNAELQQNNTELQSILAAVNALPEAGGGTGGGESVGTCAVTLIMPQSVRVFGWGENEAFFSLDNGASWTYLSKSEMPSTDGLTHALPLYGKRVFNNLPIGSTFTFYCANGIKGAVADENIEFSLANDTLSSAATYLFACCRCNGDGTITIQA